MRAAAAQKQQLMREPLYKLLPPHDRESITYEEEESGRDRLGGRF